MTSKKNNHRINLDMNCNFFNSKKKIFIIFYLTIIILFCNCTSKVQIDYCGSSNFFVKNIYDTNISVIATILDADNSCTIINIKPYETKLIYSITEFGCNPDPELVFSNLKIKNSENTIIYEQDQIINSKWKVEYKKTEKNDFYHSDYYLIYVT